MGVRAPLLCCVVRLNASGLQAKLQYASRSTPERGVPGRVEERNALLTGRHGHLKRADVLRDAAYLPCRYVTPPQLIQQRRFTVVNVPDNGDHGRPRQLVPRVLALLHSHLKPLGQRDQFRRLQRHSAHPLTLSAQWLAMLLLPRAQRRGQRNRAVCVRGSTQVLARSHHLIEGGELLLDVTL